jgi:Cu/Ag efflux protein CusF
MKQFTVLFLVSVLCTVACQRQASNTNALDQARENSSVVSDLIVSASPRMYQGEGVVTEIKLETSEIELNDEELEDVMPTPTVTFHVKDKADLEKLKIGDVVDFTLEGNAGEEMITKIKKQ